MLGYFKNSTPFFLFLSSHLIFASQYNLKDRDSFIYKYNLSKHITFDFTKSQSVELGTVRLVNTENKKKKFRYKYNSPRGYFFNKKTKEMKELELVIHNNDPERSDSLFWALLGSATYHTPVKPYGFTEIKVYLNLNFYPQPREIIKYVIKNHKNLEYHIFNPSHFSLDIKKKNSPDARIQSIHVIVPKKN